MENKLIHQVFSDTALRSGSKVAVSSYDGQLSYADLDMRSNMLAHLLRGLRPVVPGVVAVLGRPGTSLVTAFIGVLKAAGIYLPVDITLPARRIQTMIEETGCTTVITEEANLEQLREWHGKYAWPLMDIIVFNNQQRIYTVQLQSGRLRPGAQNGSLCVQPANYEAQPEQGCYIFYTSGSTGKGKAILGNYKGLGHFINWERGEFGLDESCRVSQLARMTFDASLRDMLLPLTTGGTVFIPGDEVRSNSRLLLEWLEEKKITLTHMVPSLFRLLSKEAAEPGNGGTRLQDLNQLIMAGEPLYSKDIKAWRAHNRHTELVNLYGTSETTMAKTFHRIDEIPEEGGQLIHGGQPMPGAFVIIVNNQGELCRIGEIGEIYIRTAYRTLGYLGEDTLNQKYFVQNPVSAEDTEPVHRTGDMGRYLPDRSIEILGRTDDQVKVNGVRLQLTEVEQAILNIAGIEQTVVTVHRNRQQQNELIAYYTGSKTLTTAQLRAQLLEVMSEQVIPGYWIHLEELPLSANGKVNKKELPLPDALVIREDEYQAAAPGLEQELEVLWKEVLGLERIGSKVSFFEIGGNSLKAIQLISRIYKTYGVLVKINEIFKYNTIRDLAAWIGESVRPKFQEIPVLAEQDSYELSHAQKRLWVINQAGENLHSYNVPGAFSIKGQLDINAFREAIRTLVHRHEILRTTFVEINGEPRQRVASTGMCKFGLNFINLQEAEDKEASATALIGQESHTVFDLENGPLFRITLAQLDTNDYLYLFTMHHIICDAWSQEVLNKELLAVYDALVKQQPVSIKPLRIHYKEYAAWQQKAISSTQFQQHRSYWLSHLAGPLPRLHLTADFQRPSVKTSEGKLITFELQKEVRSQLEKVAGQYNASLFAVFFSLINVVLHKYSKQEDIIIGSPVAGREYPDLENQVGLYINTILFRNKFSRTDSFEKLLNTVKDNTLKALTHQAYPFDLLLDELTFPQDRSRNILFDVGFTYFNEQILAGGQKSAFDELKITELDHQLHDVKADMWIKVVENADKLIVLLSYSSDLFRLQTIEKMAEDIRFLAAYVGSNTVASIEDLVGASTVHSSTAEGKKLRDVRRNNLGKLKAQGAVNQ